jgi:hypothetical protein
MDGGFTYNKRKQPTQILIKQQHTKFNSATSTAVLQSNSRGVTLHRRLGRYIGSRWNCSSHYCHTLKSSPSVKLCKINVRFDPELTLQLNSTNPFIRIVTSDPNTSLVHRMSNVTTDSADRSSYVVNPYNAILSHSRSTDKCHPRGFAWRIGSQQIIIPSPRCYS